MNNPMLSMSFAVPFDGMRFEIGDDSDGLEMFEIRRYVDNACKYDQQLTFHRSEFPLLARALEYSAAHPSATLRLYNENWWFTIYQKDADAVVVEYHDGLHPESAQLGGDSHHIAIPVALIDRIVGHIHDLIAFYQSPQSK